MREGVPFAEIYYKPTAFVAGRTGERLKFVEAMGKRAVCAAGIASPKSFFLTVKKLGLEVVETLSFPDHHSFSPSDIERIKSSADTHQAVIIVTEKDIVKLRRIMDDERLYYLRVDVHFSSGREEITHLIDAAINPS